MARTPVKGPVVIPNCAEVLVNYTQNGQRMSNVFHGALTAAGPINPNMGETIFSAIKAAAATTTWLTHVDPACSIVGVTVKDLRAPNNTAVESSSGGVPGTGTGSPLSQGSALCITGLTNQSGRGFRGRTYLPGLESASMTSARLVTQATADAGVAYVGAINNAMTASGLPMVIAQRALNADPAPGGLPARNATTVPVTGFVARDLRIDSQRRRLGR